MSYQIHVVSLKTLCKDGQEQLSAAGGAFCINIVEKMSVTGIFGLTKTVSGKEVVDSFEEIYHSKFSFGNNIVIAQEMIDHFGQDLANAVIAHEEGHLLGGREVGTDTIEEEYAADTHAAKKCGPEKMIAALEQVRDGKWVHILCRYNNIPESYFQTELDKVMKLRVDHLKKTFNLGTNWGKIAFWGTIAAAVLLGGTYAICKK